MWRRSQSLAVLLTWSLIGSFFKSGQAAIMFIFFLKTVIFSQIHPPLSVVDGQLPIFCTLVSVLDSPQPQRHHNVCVCDKLASLFQFYHFIFIPLSTWPSVSHTLMLQRQKYPESVMASAQVISQALIRRAAGSLDTRPPSCLHLQGRGERVESITSS